MERGTENLENASHSVRLGHRLCVEPRWERGIWSNRKGLNGQSKDLHLSPKVWGSKSKV